jgi:PhnB protein
MKLSPRLIVKDAPRAIAFYVEALGAREVVRFADPKLGGRVVHAELALGDDKLTLAEEARDWKNDAPTSLGGSPVVLELDVADADVVGARMVAAGAQVIFPIADQFYGDRQGRLRDPFGHLWLITQRIAALSSEEIQRRVDAYTP